MARQSGSPDGDKVTGTDCTWHSSRDGRANHVLNHQPLRRAGHQHLRDPKSICCGGLAPDCAIEVDGNAYSVPSGLIGERVRVTVGGSSVRMLHAGGGSRCMLR